MCQIVLLLLFPLYMSYRLYQLKLTSCLTVSQDCSIVSLKATNYKISYAMLVNLILGGVLFKDSIVFVLSAVIFIIAQ